MDSGALKRGLSSSTQFHLGSILVVMGSVGLPTLGSTVWCSVSMNSSRIRYQEAGGEGLDLIGPLWEELNEQHRLLSPHFARIFATNTFAARRAELTAKAGSGRLLVDLAKSSVGQIVGYCVSSIDAAGTGEIDSLSVAAECRRQGIGDTLMNRSLAWMDQHSVKARTVVVAAGNEQVLSFYRRYGFHPRCTVLRQIRLDGREV
jgi:diamine N-acetyltransferase